MFLVSVLYKCRTLGEEAGDDKFLLYGAAKDFIDTEVVLEVRPKDEGLASQFHTNCLFQPAFSTFPFFIHSETCLRHRSIREFL